MNSLPVTVNTNGLVNRIAEYPNLFKFDLVSEVSIYIGSGKYRNSAKFLIKRNLGPFIILALSLVRL